MATYTPLRSGALKGHAWHHITLATIFTLGLGTGCGHPKSLDPQAADTTPSVPVGYTAASFDVNASGAATYQVPITVPPGVAGMVPDLALVFRLATEHSPND